ncbi:MerR family transcriptional regulator [Tomitella fengzijianii]|uniref:MerR family transcriptional regulator n=1 Tax=Tomitella fengzijianii TaxID=2597660 RepID=A0A516X1J2_9ACTN|nr:MerR family transcriptional regulator [Tomitella fengzijianii]QDQ96954.1 MerR family transcriptional regulator [Tomitella fengzijianii]
MRIGQVAELAGTTTRTVRYYHRLGLLDEPPRRSNGYREYAMPDAIRLMRIRWLAESGVPLESVAGMLDGAGGGTAGPPMARPVEADLTALIAGIDEQRAVLARRRTRLAAMLDDAHHCRPLSPLPARLAGLFRDVLVAESTTPAARAALQIEQDMVEALTLSGKAPDGLLDGFTGLLADPDRRTRYLDLLGRWAELEHRDPEAVREEIAAITEALAGLMAHWYEGGGGDGPAAAGTAGDAPQDPALLGDVVNDPAQREVVARLHRRIRTSAPHGGSAP